MFYYVKRYRKEITQREQRNNAKDAEDAEDAKNAVGKIMTRVWGKASDSIFSSYINKLCNLKIFCFLLNISLIECFTLTCVYTFFLAAVLSAVVCR